MSQNSHPFTLTLRISWKSVKLEPISFYVLVITSYRATAFQHNSITARLTVTQSTQNGVTYCAPAKPCSMHNLYRKIFNLIMIQKLKKELVETLVCEQQYAVSNTFYAYVYLVYIGTALKYNSEDLNEQCDVHSYDRSWYPMVKPCHYSTIISNMSLIYTISYVVKNAFIM